MAAQAIEHRMDIFYSFYAKDVHTLLKSVSIKYLKMHGNLLLFKIKIIV